MKERKRLQIGDGRSVKFKFKKVLNIDRWIDSYSFIKTKSPLAIRKQFLYDFKIIANNFLIVAKRLRELKSEHLNLYRVNNYSYKPTKDFKYLIEGTIEVSDLFLASQDPAYRDIENED